MIIPNISTERHQPSSGEKKNANESERERESKGKVVEARRELCLNNNRPSFTMTYS